MPRAATTADVFNAIAEPRRRQIVDLLASGRPRAVGELVDRMRLSQPAVSKHLGVLRKVGLVSANRQGKRRLYQINPGRLKPVHDWVKTFEPFWDHKLVRIKKRAERKARERSATAKRPNVKKEE
jgi:DNA-binding transcriptional ArsR family regulator